MNINDVFAHVDELFESKQTEKVEPYLLECLEKAEKENDLTSVIPICNELGGYYRAIGSYESGIPLYRKALDALDSLDLKGSEHHATTLVNYATTYAVKGEPREALDLFEQAAVIFEELGLGQDYRVATLHNNMSILCRDADDPQKALEHLDKALSILRTLSDSESEVAITYTNIAQAHFELKDYAAAASNAAKAIEIFESVSGDSDVHYSAALETLGQVSMALGSYENALGYFGKVMTLTERDYGMDSLAYKAVSRSAEECRRLIEEGGNS